MSYLRLSLFEDAFSSGLFDEVSGEVGVFDNVFREVVVAFNKTDERRPLITNAGPRN